MSDTKALIVFIACSALILIGIGLLPESVPMPSSEVEVTAANSAIVHVIQTPGQAQGEKVDGWKVTVQKY